MKKDYNWVMVSEVRKMTRSGSGCLTDEEEDEDK